MIVAPEGSLTIEAYLEFQCTTCDPHPLELATINGIPVQRMVGGGGGGGVQFEIEWIFLTDNGNFIGFSFHDAETLASLEGVLATLRLEVEPPTGIQARSNSSHWFLSGPRTTLRLSIGGRLV